MKKIFTLLFFTSLLSINAISQTNDLLKYLPEKAGLIIDIDGGSLSQKLSWKELMEMSMFDSLLKKAEPGTSKMIAEPSETGINFRDHLYFVVDYAEGEKGFVAFYGKVLDETKLGTLINKTRIKEIIKKTSGENKMIIGRNFVFGWNKSVFVLHSGRRMGTEIVTTKKPQPLSKKELARLETKCNELLRIKTSNIYNTNKHFGDLVSEKADMRIWIDIKKINGLGKGKNPFSMFGISDFQGEYKTAVVNFEDGKIVSKGYTYYNNEIAPSMQKIYAEKLNTELIKKIPAGNLMGLWAMSFNPDGINEFLKKTGIWEEFRKTEIEADFDPGIILNQLKGDILFAVSMPEQQEEISEEGEEKNPLANLQIYFAASVKDEKRVNQLIDSLKTVMAEKKKAREESADVVRVDTVAMFPGEKRLRDDSLVIVIEEKKMITDEKTGLKQADTARMAPAITFPDSLVRDEEVKEEYIYPTQKNNPFKDLKPVHKVENGVFIFSLSEKQLAKFGTTTTNAYDKLINEYGSYPTLMTIDLKTIFSIVLSSMQKKRQFEEEDPEMYSFFEVFDKWVIAGGKYENGKLQTMQEIKFTSPRENSLKQIMKMFDLVFQAVTKTKIKQHKG